MVQDFGYLWEKLHVAVLCLASGDGSLDRRVADAWVSALVRLNDADVPPEMLGRWQALHAAVTRIADPERGSIEASVAAMNDAELRRHAETIVALYDLVCHMRGPEHVID